MPKFIAGCVVATLAFVLYSLTLLPGVDLGDTGGFQSAVLWPDISARQAYPLYYALAKPFVGTLSAANPARGLNLFSAVWAAVAAGLLTVVVMVVTRSTVAGAIAGLLLAGSYTFWMQAIIAEVYSLHLALVGACLVALATYAHQPSTWRLAAFFAIYALAFGNHLSMILLLVPFAVFLLMNANRPAALLRPRVILLAVAIAVAGALQYVPNLLAVWNAPDAPERWTDRVAAFWFDVTKADWRASSVLGVGPDQFADRVAMFAFDARQQFGLAGLALAAAGCLYLLRAHRTWGVLIGLAYATNTLFAFTYNVGDPHVFFLPGHYFVAFAAGAAIAGALHGLRTRPAAAALVAGAAFAYAGWRAFDTWPAVDRHQDRRAEHLVAHMTSGLDERDALLVTQLNWQVENALLYETRYRLRHVVWTRLGDVFLTFPLLVRDNHAGGRDVVLTAAAARQVGEAFGPLFPLVRDQVPPTPTLESYAARIPRGAPYVLTMLTPPRDEPIEPEVLRGALAALTGGRAIEPTNAAYEVIVGRAGESPLFRHSAPRPFRRRITLAEGALDIRMDGWVSIETFRRGGFGHVIFNRRPVLIVERGVSLTWLDETRSAQPFYAAGLYAPRPRFRIAAEGAPRLALLH